MLNDTLPSSAMAQPKKTRQFYKFCLCSTNAGAAL